MPISGTCFNPSKEPTAVLTLNRMWIIKPVVVMFQSLKGANGRPDVPGE